METEEQKLTAMKKIMQLLPPVNKEILVMLLSFVREVIAHSEENKMDASNLATCLGPNILRLKNDTSIIPEDFKKVNAVFIFLVTHYDQLFTTQQPNHTQAELPPSFQKQLNTGAIRIASLVLKEQEELQIASQTSNATMANADLQAKKQVDSFILSSDITRLLKELPQDPNVVESMKKELSDKLQTLQEETANSTVNLDPNRLIHYSSSQMSLEEDKENEKEDEKEKEKTKDEVDKEKEKEKEVVVGSNPTTVISIQERLASQHVFIIPINHKPEEMPVAAPTRKNSLRSKHDGPIYEGEMKNDMRNGKGKTHSLFIDFEKTTFLKVK